MMVRDPVCQMEINSEKAAERMDYQGVSYYFCAPACAKAFARNPQEYLAEAGHKHAAGHQHEHRHEHHGGGGCGHCGKH